MRTDNTEIGEWRTGHLWAWLSAVPPVHMTKYVTDCAKLSVLCYLLLAELYGVRGKARRGMRVSITTAWTF